MVIMFFVQVGESPIGIKFVFVEVHKDTCRLMGIDRSWVIHVMIKEQNVSRIEHYLYHFVSIEYVEFSGVDELHDH